MTPAWGHATGVVTVILMLIFLGIWAWAWRKRHRSGFDLMSRLPLEDKPEGPLPDLRELPAQEPKPSKEAQP